MPQNKERKASSWYKLFCRGWINRLSLAVVVFTAATALLAPLLASSEPLYLKYEGKTYFPVLKKLWPLKYFNLYPELLAVDSRQLKKNGASFLDAPVPYAPDDYDFEQSLKPPSRQHWLGTDHQGRDVLSRMIHGSRVSLSVGLIAVSLYTGIGLFMGALAGYFGGRLDMTVSRLIEIVICFPTFFLILSLISVLGQSLFYIMLVIGLTGWTGIARLVRGEFLKLRHQDFVSACRSQGMNTWRILFKHMLTNALAPVWVSATFGIASAILIESSLSFLGFGVPLPTPSWGDLLSQSRNSMDVAWWLTLFPGLAIFVTITSYNLVGEGLRDALDPKLRR